MFKMLKWCTRLRLRLLLLCLTLSSLQAVHGYSQVALSGSQDNGESPKIFKALNMDLIFPETFNATVQTPTTTTTARYLTDAYALKYEATTKPTLFITPATTIVEPDIYENVQQSQQQIAQEQFEQQKQQQQLAQQQIEQQQQYASTGRAIDYAPTYQLGQLIQPLIKNSARPAPATYRRPLPAPVRSSASSSALGKLVYPQPHQQRQPSRAGAVKWRKPAEISHRFSPGEAVASAHFLKQQQDHHAHTHPKGSGGKVSAATNIVQTYVPPKNLYAFPPNQHINYPSPSEDPKARVPTGSVNSYLAPASGPLSNSAGYPLVAASSNSNGYKYKGPLNLDYLPPGAASDEQKENVSGGPSDDDSSNMIGVLPASAMDAAPDDTNGGSADAMSAMDTPPADAHDHDHDHDHDYAHDHSLSGYDTGVEYPTPPPGWLEEHPEAAHDPPKDAPSATSMPDSPPDAPPSSDDHDHHHDHDEHHFEFPDAHDHFPSFPGYSSFHNHYPDIIYDDHPHHHHPAPPLDLPPITTIPPPPEPAPEPRVKKYSYFYIGRKLWYIPLYFTVWFSFYVLWLILKSIARHKVNLPNHYVNRRSLPENADAKAQEYINQLTVKVLEQIDGFKRKYLT